MQDNTWLNDRKSLEDISGIPYVDDEIRLPIYDALEFGYVGTIPMMLASLDDRETFKLYTLVSYLYETYQDLNFCRRYEDIRKFETVYSQDQQLKYATFR